jgi:hypothetical protein
VPVAVEATSAAALASGQLLRVRAGLRRCTLHKLQTTIIMNNPPGIQL